MPCLITNDAKPFDGKVVADPTQSALLALGHKVKLDIEGTQPAYPRLETLLAGCGPGSRLSNPQGVQVFAPACRANWPSLPPA